MINYFNNIAIFFYIFTFILIYSLHNEYNCEKILEHEEETKKEIKYEDKYLDKFKNLKDDFTEEDKKLEEDKYEELKIELENSITNIEKRMEILHESHKKLQEDSDKDKSEESDGNQENMDDYILLDKNKKKEEEIKDELYILFKELEYLKSKNIKNEAHEVILKNKRDKLKNSFIIETTPIGNVLMFYNNARETFTYYSDNNIPYRFLEVVARKYVITFDCKSIYVNMEDVLREAEEAKKLKEQKEKEIKEKEQKEQELESDNRQQKKDVFAKFKNYNKNNSKSSSANAKISNNVEKNKDDGFIVKNNANRYTHEGKLSNFNILQKIDKKLTNKKLTFSFADFKKKQLFNDKIKTQ